LISIGSTFESNTAEYGGAIYSDDGHILLFDTVFESNTATYSGGAIYVSIDSILFSYNTQFYYNSAAAGGAVFSAGQFVSGYNSTMYDTYYENEAELTGGAIYVSQGTMVVNYSKFKSNEQISEKDTSYGGGAIYIKAGTADVYSGSEFYYSKAYYGGSIFVHAKGILNLGETVTFTGDSATAAGANCYYSDTKETSCIRSSSYLVDPSSIELIENSNELSSNLNDKFSFNTFIFSFFGLSMVVLGSIYVSRRKRNAYQVIGDEENNFEPI